MKKLFSIPLFILGIIFILGSIGGFASKDYIGATITLLMGLFLLFISARESIINGAIGIVANFSNIKPRIKERSLALEKTRKEEMKEKKPFALEKTKIKKTKQKKRKSSIKKMQPEKLLKIILTAIVILIAITMLVGGLSIIKTILSTDSSGEPEEDVWTKNSGYTLSDCKDVCNTVYDIQIQATICINNCNMYGKPSDSMDHYVNTIKEIE